MKLRKPPKEGEHKAPYRGVVFRSLRDGEIRLSDDSLLDAVFSGGYYIVLSNESGDAPRVLRKDVNISPRKKEEILRLANQVRLLVEEGGTLQSANKEHIRPQEHAPLREKLLSDLQTLINKSNYNNTDYDLHLSHELDIARRQVLNGGAIDDYALMQTLQEIASIQGLSVAGTSMRGRFASDIMNTPEPEARAEEKEAACIPAQQNRQCLPEDSALGEYDQFNSYRICQVGEVQQYPSYFFARKVVKNLFNIEIKQEQEQNSAEIAP